MENKKIQIKIAEKIYLVSLAESDEDKETGLQNIETLPENEGMLFVFEAPEEISF